MRSFNTFPENTLGGRLWLSCALVGLAALCFAASAAALDPTRAVSQYLHDSWGAERGLLGESITAMAQTSDGYLWIGTDKGLVRFDGLNFRQFDRASPDPILIGPVRTLVVDASDNLWILLQNTQVFRYHGGIFEPIRGWKEGGTTAMVRGTSGAVLISTPAAGTLTYSENGFRSVSSANPLAAPQRGMNSESPKDRATPFSWFDRLASPTSLVTSMAQTGDGKIWLATEDRGLFYLREGRISQILSDRADTKINCFLPLPNSELWTGTTNGMRRWDGKRLTADRVPPSLLKLDILSILRDRDSNIWVGTNHGLFRYNENGISSLGAPEVTGPVTGLFEDREGNIWFGSARRLERLRDSAFVTYSLPDLNSQSTGPLHVDSSGLTWVAPIEGGLRWLKRGQSGAVIADGVANDVVYSIAGIHNDDVWLGRQRRGLTHLRHSGDSFTATTYTQADGLAQDSVFAVYESLDGAIWAGTLSGGVSKFKDGHFTNYTTANGLTSDTVTAIAESPDGTMWFGTPEGLSAFTKTGWHTYKVSDGLVSQDINCLLQDSIGTLWIGTSEGLAIFRDGRITALKTVPNSLREPVLGIAEDRYGSLWVATAEQVLQVKSTSLVSGTPGYTDVREYGPPDGLLGTEGVKRFVSVAADTQGRVWISTNRGLSVVRPSRENTTSAIVHIDALLADNSPLNLQEPVRIPAASQRVTVRYVGLSLSNPEHVRYRYKLDNFDHSWSEPISTREVSFTNLSSGPYVFRVMASNSDGLWNSKEVTFPFTVEPVFWRTWWFGLTSLLLLGLAALALIRLREHALARQLNMTFEARLAERTRIARDLHDTLLQSFNALLPRLQTVANALPERPDEARRRIEGALEQATQAAIEGRDAVHELRSTGSMTVDLDRAIGDFARELLNGSTAESAPEVYVHVEGSHKELNPAIRDEVFRIVAEATRNAIRHANARQITIDIRYDANQLHLRIDDDGTGIDPSIIDREHKPGHWGLRGMRERAKLVGGVLEIRSRPPSGTEITLNIPAASIYLKPSSGRRSVLSLLGRG